MTYLIKHDRPVFFRDKFKNILVIIALALALLAFGWFGFLKNFVSDALSPFLKIGNDFYGFWGCAASSDQNFDLQTIDYQVLKEENQKLREELGLRPQENSLTASVIGKPPQTPIGSIYIDAGSERNIKEGDLVLASDKVLLGKVVKISKNNSTVSLNSSAGAVSYGFVARTEEQIEIKGAGGASMEAEVPIDFDIESGDKIMQNDSPSYLMAVVGVIESNQTAGLKKIYLSLPVSISKINTVFVKLND